ncbi:MAG: GNAT family N-acetyltransferase [Pseudonocardiaceae bacterium]|nr:GNAT family N-acetyltransferase [Pseudonocardiaceae bacterium]
MPTLRAGYAPATVTDPTADESPDDSKQRRAKRHLTCSTVGGKLVAGRPSTAQRGGHGRADPGPVAVAPSRAAHLAADVAAGRRRGAARTGRDGCVRGAPAGGDALRHAVDRPARRRVGDRGGAALLGRPGRDFAITREVSTGSWLGREHQGRGYGTEMRAAVLLLAFDHLGAVTARSGAFSDNPTSMAVSRKLGYREDGSTTHVRRGEKVTKIRMLLTCDQLVRPQWTLEVDGLGGCRALLGARSEDRPPEEQLGSSGHAPFR